MARQKKATNLPKTLNFGAWLRSHREARKLPLRSVAAAAEMDQAHLSKVELGQRLATAEQVAALARFFAIDVNEFEARRIAEKFRWEHANNPAAQRAILMLREDPVIFKNNPQIG